MTWLKFFSCMSKLPVLQTKQPERWCPRVFLFCSTGSLDMQLKNLSQVMECSLSLYEDFRDRIVRRHLIGMHSIRSNPASKDQNPHETRIESQFPTKKRSIRRRSYLWTFFGLLKNPHETRINTGENDYCKKKKKLAWILNKIRSILKRAEQNRQVL